MSAANLKVAHAKEVLKRIGGRGCVIMIFDNEQFSVVEWGRDKRECGKLKRFIDAIADKIGTSELPAP